MSAETMIFLLRVFEVMAALFVLVIAGGLVAVAVMYVIDVRQTQHAIRRNYPVIGRFRYWFEHLGEFLRQYFFALDREEMPFNRAQRSWAYRAAKDVDNTVAFGSTRDLRPTGTVIFVNTPFPTLESDAVEAPPLLVGPLCRTPYLAPSFFNISAMSYGALSRPALRALSNGAKNAGCWLNTGEGGLAPYHLEGGCDVVFQMGTAKYGVRDEHGALSDERLREVAARPQVRMFEVKLSQGAKPGKGGILPAIKVTEEIAAIRGIPVGQASISPNGHPEIANVGQLLDMIGRIREVTGKPTGFKAVIGDVAWIDELCRLVRERGIESAPDFITVDGGDGGTGAAPMALMDDVGLPLRESLPLVVDTLTEHGLRERVRVIASGKLITPADVAWALCCGADFINTARGFMFALGCIQAMQCNRNTCPTGITTHDPDLQRGLDPADKAVRVAHFHHNMVKEVGTIAHSCGVTSPRGLRRGHARVVTDSGRSILLSEMFPEATPQPEAVSALPTASAKSG